MLDPLRRWFARFHDHQHLEENLNGLRRALETQQRVMDDLHQQLEARDAQVESLRQEYAALDRRGNDQLVSALEAERMAMFHRLQPLLTQLPTLSAALDQGADITARDVLNLLAPLNQMLGDLGFVSIGQAGEEVAYDSRRHRLVSRDAAGGQPDGPVRVRYVGYMYQDQVICKADVTRIEPE